MGMTDISNHLHMDPCTFLWLLQSPEKGLVVDLTVVSLMSILRLLTFLRGIISRTGYILVLPGSRFLSHVNMAASSPFYRWYVNQCTRTVPLHSGYSQEVLHDPLRTCPVTSG